LGWKQPKDFSAAPKSWRFSHICLLFEAMLRDDFRNKNVFHPQEKSEFGMSQHFSFRKCPKSAPT